MLARRLQTGVNTAAFPGLITRSGAHLLRNGKPYLLTGVNIYNANSIDNYWYRMGDGQALQQALDAINMPGGVFRAWFGQWLAKPTANTFSWAPFDHTFDVAAANGWQVLPVFADQDGTWDDGISKKLDSNWYQSGYKTVVSSAVSSWGAVNTMTYKDFVLSVVSRYKNHPALAFWQLANEVEPKPVDELTITEALQDEACNILKSWADDMAAAIKAEDPLHLVSLGTIGTGQFGTSGGRYQVVHSGANIDLCEMHDYVAAEDIIGDQWNGMQLRLDQAAALGKPLFIGETGIDPTAVGGLGARATRFAQKWNAQKTAGVQGWLPWEWRNSGNTGGDTYVFEPDDPLLPVLRDLGSA